LYYADAFVILSLLNEYDDDDVKFKYESSTTILFVGIRYSILDLLSYLNNYT